MVDFGQTTIFVRFGVVDLIPYYWLALTVIILVLLGDTLIKNSRVCRSWEATREDEDAAELMGVPTFRFKLLAFAMGAFVGGLAGALFAGRQGFVSPQSFLLLLYPFCRCRRGGRPGQPVGRHDRCGDRRLPAREVPRFRGVARDAVRSCPDRPGDLPAAGNPAAASYGPGTSDGTGDRGTRRGHRRGRCPWLTQCWMSTTSP